MFRSMPSLSHLESVPVQATPLSTGPTEDGGLPPLPFTRVVVSRERAALYLLSSGLMACGLMGPVRMGLVVEMGGFSGSGRSLTA